MRVRGHTLVWHESNPPWLADALRSGADGERILVDHIHNVAGHFQGRIAQWDVVNEAVDPADGEPHGLRRTLWLDALGPRYLDVAFTTCAFTDPRSLRVLNEFGVDYAIPWQERKRGALLGVLSDLVARNVPVQAVGLQGHLDAAERRLDQKVLAQFAADIASLGLAIVVTELDVRDDRLPADTAVRDVLVAGHARAWLEPLLENPALIGVVTWGLSDRRSWLNQAFPRPDGLQQRPLPLDESLQRKPLWQAMCQAFDATREVRAPAAVHTRSGRG
jgi:endo-1,4-beta-xylanase